MFVMNMKVNKKKALLTAVAFLALVGALVVILIAHKTAPTVKEGISLKAGTEQERVAFLSQFGWEIGTEPFEVAEVIIPQEFDDTYKSYNDLQKTQGFDLNAFKAKRVKRWTYEVKNYPGYAPDSGCIYANILVSNGVVIAGDVCSVELNGFMQGFEYPDKDIPEQSSAKQ